MDLYSEIILDYFKNPKNKGEISQLTFSAEDKNESCGDEIKIFIQTDKKGIVKKAKFLGQGCAISQAATSMLLEKIEGKSIKKIKKITDKDIIKMLGIKISAGRIKCALIGLQTLKKALG